jgi:hypothetical protein
MSATAVKLVGVNVIGNPAKVSKDVAGFVSEDGHFEVRLTMYANTIKLITPTNTYALVKHPTQNYFRGLWGKTGKRKIQVSLKKIVGEVRYW